jgi:hypothetical protein
MLPRLIVLALSGWLLLCLAEVVANPVVPPGPFGPAKNEAPPRRPEAPLLPPLRRTVGTTLTIEVAPGAPFTTLQLPRQVLADLQTASLPAEESPAPTGADLGRLYTLAAGLALALALTVAGLWAVRSRGRFGVGGLALLLAVIAAAGVSCFNFGRKETMPQPPQPLQQTGDDTLAGSTAVTVEQEDGIRLNLIRDELERIAEARAPK